MANGGIIGTVNTPTSTTATGVWQQEEQYEAKVTDTWPQRALFTTNSCRFNESDDCLIKTFGSAGNRKLWTFSVWFKRGKLGGSYALFVAGSAGNDEGTIRIEADKIDWQHYDVGTTSTDAQLLTSQLIRDPSAWYNLQCVYDSANSTAGDRMKMFLNGSEITSFSTDNNPSLNYDSAINNNVLHNIGRQSWNSSADFSGYMAEICFIDGQALTPTSFGVANSDGVWTPIPYTGTFGTNGFKLQFEDAAALGTDSSPNGNTFTVNNLTSIDQSTDYPVVNYATWNPLFRKGTTTPAFAEGNLQSTFDDGGANEFALTTFGASSGKWYTEVKWVSATGTGATSTGILDMGYSGTADPNNAVTNTFAYFGSGQKNVSGTASSYGASYTSGDIISIALNCDDNQVTFYKNGASQGVISIIAGVTYGFMTSDYNNKVCQLNTGNPPYSISSGNADGNGYGNFEYAVPSGYYALNTANLAEFG
jgi:hypothetical protein